jgi:hypothetical protein
MKTTMKRPTKSLNPGQVALFIEYINNRYKAYLQSEADRPKPWTKDVILQNFQFPNVSRNHSPLSKFIDRFYFAEHHESPVLWFNLIIARIVKDPSTLEEIGYIHNWDPKKFGQVADAAIDFFVDLGNGPVKVSSEDIMGTLLGPIWDHRDKAPLDCFCCEYWNDFFENYLNVHYTIRNKIMSDLKTTDWLDYWQTEDWTTFAIPDEIALRGLNRLLDKELNERPGIVTVLGELYDLRREILYKTIVEFTVFEDLNNLVDCLRGFDRYYTIKEALDAGQNIQPDFNGTGEDKKVKN